MSTELFACMSLNEQGLDEICNLELTYSSSKVYWQISGNDVAVAKVFYEYNVFYIIAETCLKIWHSSSFIWFMDTSGFIQNNFLSDIMYFIVYPCQRPRF